VSTTAQAYRQVTKHCERCKTATPHQVRENDGLVAKICIVCLLRGYLSRRERHES